LVKVINSRHQREKRGTCIHFFIFNND